MKLSVHGPDPGQPASAAAPPEPHANLSAPPRLLLVSQCAAGAGHVGEVVLADILRARGAGKIHCVSLRAPARAEADLSAEAMTVLSRFDEPLRAAAQGRMRWLADFAAAAQQHAARAPLCAELAQIASQQQSQVLLLVMNSPAMIQVAARLAQQTNLPLLLLVWDDVAQVAQQFGLGRFSSWLLRRQFARALGAAAAVAVVSETMAADYRAQYGAHTLFLRHGRSRAARQSARTEAQEILIGFAGAMHGRRAFNSLVAALDSVDWHFEGLPVRLRITSPSLRVSSSAHARLEYLGWGDEQRSFELLQEADIAYLPHPFEAHLRPVARYSFPTKLSSYLAACLPVLAHAPADSSVASFFHDHPVGACCDSLEPPAVLAALKAVWTNRERFREQAELVHEQVLGPRQFEQQIGKLIAAAGVPT